MLKIAEYADNRDDAILMSVPGPRGIGNKTPPNL